MPNMGQNRNAKSVKFTYNMDDFNKNVNNYIKNAQQRSKQIVIKVTPEFVKGAVKYTPPDMGHNTIDKKRYNRPILNLIKLVRGEYDGYSPTKEDAHELRYNKMRYKVLYTKAGIKQGTAFAYTKTISAAKKAARIANRGISRIMWGKNIESIGMPIPPSVQRLIAKSPNTQKHNLNRFNLTQFGDETSMEIVNDVAQIERYAQIAERQGYKKVKSAINRELRKMADENKEL